MTTGHRPKTKGYTVKIIDGKPTLVRKITFRTSIAQRKQAAKALRVVKGKRLV